jgi:hypothetical protein
MAYFDPRETPQ